MVAHQNHMGKGVLSWQSSDQDSASTAGVVGFTPSQGVHPNRREVSLTVVLICISLMMSGCSIFFHVLFGHLHIIFGEMSI